MRRSTTALLAVLSLVALALLLFTFTFGPAEA